MRSLICFVFLMSASICMLAVTPVQVSADGDADNLTASLTDNSDSVLADSDADGDDEVEKKTQEQIKKEKADHDVKIADKSPGIRDVKELIDSELKRLKDAGLKTTEDLIALGIPDPAKYDTDKEWHKAFSDWTKKNGDTPEQAMEWFNEWLRVARNCKDLLAHKRTLAKLIEAKEKLVQDKEDHCQKWPITSDGDDSGND